MRASVALCATIAYAALARAAPGSSPHLPAYDAENAQKPFSPPGPEVTKRILLIGAGTAGTSALKALLVDLPEESRRGWEVTVFEQRFA